TLRALDYFTGNPNTTTSLDDARVDLSQAADSYELHVFSADGVLLAGHFEHGHQKVLQRAALTRGGLDEQSDSTTPNVPLLPSLQDDSGFWSEFPATASHVLTEASAATLHLSGPFTLEILGLDLR